ncbi:MAG: radical SAM protein [bacterium]|nr:radical SAM protein [bacterium]
MEKNKMIPSKYNIFSKLKNSDTYFLVNLLYGNVDILTPEKADEIKTGTFTDIDEYIEKGYLVDAKEENKQYKLKYLDFLEQRENDEVQVFFVPRYSCNFACSYCYQADYHQEYQPLQQEVVDAFYRYIDTALAGKRKYITIFGGEPLLHGDGAKEDIKALLSGAKKRNLDVAVVTNGYYLDEYLDILTEASVREIQVTLDGTKQMHDLRRSLRNGGGTFDKIVRGIDQALEKNFPINLRVVVDKENLSSVLDLSEYAIKKGWTRNPKFKTQLGRNYELHSCNQGMEKLFTRIGLYEEVYKLVRHYPRFLEFHRPAYSVSRFLFENGRLPAPLFDSCPGTKTEWAFDYTGHIYSCTATVGKADESLGTFFPVVELKEELIEQWEDRDVTSIEKCRDCAYQLACGGGCGSVAKNRVGSVNAPDCRPVKELLEMGIELYFKEEIET